MRIRGPKSVPLATTFGVGILLRLGLLAVLSRAGDKASDVDYLVIRDGARHVANGGSPYLRHTYRYSPIIAYLMLPSLVFPNFGKYLFSFLDVLNAYLIYRQVRSSGLSPTQSLRVASAWLFNPISIAMGCRGSMESLHAAMLLGMLSCLDDGRFALAGVLYGLAVSVRIIPALYAPAIGIAILTQSGVSLKALRAPHRNLARTARKLRPIVAFGAACAAALALTTATFFALYRGPYLYESVGYHLVRKDHRHNLSVHWYGIWLHSAEAADAPTPPLWRSKLIDLGETLGLTLLLSSFASMDLPFAMAMITLALVAFNRVLTLQYYHWYLLLVVRSLPKLRMSTTALFAITGAWLASQGVWFRYAYLLEYGGAKINGPALWGSSIALLLTHIAFAAYLVARWDPRQTSEKKRPHVSFVIPAKVVGGAAGP